MYTNIHLEKMIATVSKTNVVNYLLKLRHKMVLPVNPLVGKRIAISDKGFKECVHCHQKTDVLKADGFCLSCYQTLARCDECRVKPELCHYDQGTCREPKWGEENCLKAHYVYLSNTSGLKVGITRHVDEVSRWIDQGAKRALPLFKVKKRLWAGYIEREIAKYMSDRTNINKVLKGESDLVDLDAVKQELLPKLFEFLVEFKKVHGDDSFDMLDEPMKRFHYPVKQWAEKVKHLSLAKTPVIEGRLLGVIGQYWLLDCGVFNVRKHSGYCVDIKELDEVN